MPWFIEDKLTTEGTLRLMLTKYKAGSSREEVINMRAGQYSNQPTQVCLGYVAWQVIFKGCCVQIRALDLCLCRENIILPLSPSLSTVPRVPGNLIRGRRGAGLHAPRLIVALLSATRHRRRVPAHCWARGSSSCKHGCGRPQTTIVTAVCYWERASVLD